MPWGSEKMLLPVLSCLLLVLPVPDVAAGDDGKSCRLLLPAGGQAGSFEGWQSYHEGGASTQDVWTLDDQGVLHSKGSPLGYLYTENEYGSFVLELDWRWPPGEPPGKGGVLIRTTGPHKIWPKSLEAQINAGDAGDFWGLDGYQLDGPEDRRRSLDHPQFGKLTNLKKTAAVERPAGQWNHYKITADGDTVTLEINGQVINRAVGCETAPGKIVLTAEGSPIEFRHIRLTRVD
jgi:hypothetical protein